jgi:hypothetical protein
MPPDFLSNDIGHPHHRKAIWAGVAAVIIGGAIVWGYIAAKHQAPIIAPVTSTSSQALNPAQLTAEQIKSRQEILNASTPSVPLTAKQIEERQKLLQGN